MEDLLFQVLTRVILMISTLTLCPIVHPHAIKALPMMTMDSTPFIGKSCSLTINHIHLSNLLHLIKNKFHFNRDLFSKLTAEELEAGWADENDDDIPNFGDSCSSYEDVCYLTIFTTTNHKHDKLY
jgi:hypothetical protein